MRKTPNLDVERYRIRHGDFASSRADGNNGQFLLPAPAKIVASDIQLVLLCMVGDGAGWEHVSVSVKELRRGSLIETNRCPTWEEMCHVKDLFWEREECVIQFHPRGSQYRNYHHYVLHLWRPTEQTIPEPHPDFIGPRSGETEEEVLARWRDSA